MNRVMYLCTAAVLALASCSNDEIVEIAQGDAISFRSVVGLNTRASELTTAGLQQNGKLYVTTFKGDGDLLFDETEFSYNGSEWAATPAQFWGKNDKLDFYITYPKLDEWQKDFKLTKDNLGEWIRLITVDEDIPDQKDYVWACLKDVSKTSLAVPVTLKHACAQIEMKAKNDNSNYIIKVKGIRLNGVNKQAQFQFSTGTCTYYAINTRDYELIYDSPVILDGTVKSLMGTAGSAILPPQPPVGTLAYPWDGNDVTSLCTYLSVKINVTTKRGASVYPAGSTADNETYGWAAVGVEYAWGSGNKYIYTLDFTNGAGRVDPKDPGVDVDPGGNDPEKGEPILGNPINFTVTVTDWNEEKNDVELN